MNQVFIKGDVEQIIDSNKLIYKVFDGEMIWIVNSTKQLQQGWNVEIIGIVSLDSKYIDKGTLIIESLRYVIVDADKVDILSVENEQKDFVGIIW